MRRRPDTTAMTLIAAGLMIFAPTQRADAQSAVWQPLGATTGNIYYNSGNVGIGTAGPSYPLSILPATNGSVLQVGNGTYVGSFNGQSLFGNATFNAAGAWTAQQTGASLVSADPGGSITFYTNAGLTPGSGFAPAARMKIDPLGNVGVGTTSPAGPLHVISNQNSGLIVQTSSAASNMMAFVDGAASPHTWWVGQGLSTTTDGTFTIFDQPAGASRFNILRNGNVGIGNVSPAFKLDVQGGQVNSSGGYCINGSNCITAWPSATSNTWSGVQTFSTNTNFPSGVWTRSLTA